MSARCLWRIVGRGTGRVGSVSVRWPGGGVRRGARWNPPGARRDRGGRGPYMPWRSRRQHRGRPWPRRVQGKTSKTAASIGLVVAAGPTLLQAGRPRSVGLGPILVHGHVLPLLPESTRLVDRGPVPVERVRLGHPLRRDPVRIARDAGGVPVPQPAPAKPAPAFDPGSCPCSRSARAGASPTGCPPKARTRRPPGPPDHRRGPPAALRLR